MCAWICPYYSPSTIPVFKHPFERLCPIYIFRCCRIRETRTAKEIEMHPRTSMPNATCAGTIWTAGPGPPVLSLSHMPNRLYGYLIKTSGGDRGFFFFFLSNTDFAGKKEITKILNPLLIIWCNQKYVVVSLFPAGLCIYCVV